MAKESLSGYQQLLLRAAASHDIIPRAIQIPHGVYRSLVIRGLLIPCEEGYEITPEGREALR